MSSIAYGRGLPQAHEEHYQPQVLEQTPQEITRDVLEETARVSSKYKKVLAFFGLLFVLGIVGFVLRLVDVGGFDDLSPWAYLMVGYAFLLTTAASAPLFSVTHGQEPLAAADGPRVRDVRRGGRAEHVDVHPAHPPAALVGEPGEHLV